MTQFSVHTDLLETAYANALWAADQSTYWTDAAYVHWAANQDHSAINDLIRGVQWNNQSINYLIDKYTAASPPYRLIKILRLCWEYTNWTMPVYTLTAVKICEAWIKNSFKDRAITIAVIDRMRQLIWDEPFYAVWASKPEEQEF